MAVGSKLEGKVKLSYFPLIFLQPMMGVPFNMDFLLIIIGGVVVDEEGERFLKDGEGVDVVVGLNEGCS